MTRPAETPFQEQSWLSRPAILPKKKAQNEDELVGYVVAVTPKQPPGTPPVNPQSAQPGQPVTLNLPPGCPGIDVSCDPPGSATKNSGTSYSASL